MKEMEPKSTPKIGGGAYMPTPTFPGGPINTPTYPGPEFPQNPTTPVEPITGTQKL